MNEEKPYFSRLFQSLSNYSLSLSALTLSVGLVAGANAACTPGSLNTWHVDPSAADGGDGSLAQPLNLASDIDVCSKAGDTIILLKSQQTLVGPIHLKSNQRLVGHKAFFQKFYPTVGVNDVNETSVIYLADGVTVKNLRIKDVTLSADGRVIGSPGDALLSGDITLENISITQDISNYPLPPTVVGTIAVDLRINGSEPGSLTMHGIDVKAINAPAGYQDINTQTFGRGLRVEVGADFANMLPCNPADYHVDVQYAFVNKTNRNIDVRHFCDNNMRLNLHDSVSLNSLSDSVLLFNAGSLTTDINNLIATNSPGFRYKKLTENPFALAAAGSDFSLEYFGLPSADQVNIKVRNSEFSRGAGPGIGILGFPQGTPGAKTTVDLGCSKQPSKCLAKGFHPSPGHNAIFDNIPGHPYRGVINTLNDPEIKINYANYLVAPGGLAPFFASEVSPDIANNIGKTVELYLAIPNGAAIIGQGNYWGPGVRAKGLGTCMELQYDNMLVASQANPNDVNQWRCVLDNSFDFGEFVKQPKTNKALKVHPWLLKHNY